MSEGNGTNFKPGDVVNGWMLTESGQWVAAGPPPQPGARATAKADSLIRTNSHSRPTGERLFITLGLFVAIGVSLVLISIPLAFALPASPSDGSDAIGSLVVYGCTFGIFGWLATKVSYRWFDAFFLIVPVYGVIWIFRVLWRVANLPHKDWSPRPEEV